MPETRPEPMTFNFDCIDDIALPNRRQTMNKNLSNIVQFIICNVNIKKPYTFFFQKLNEGVLIMCVEAFVN